MLIKAFYDKCSMYLNLKKLFYNKNWIRYLDRIFIIKFVMYQNVFHYCYTFLDKGKVDVKILLVKFLKTH